MRLGGVGVCGGVWVCVCVCVKHVTCARVQLRVRFSCKHHLTHDARQVIVQQRTQDTVLRCLPQLLASADTLDLLANLCRCCNA